MSNPYQGECENALRDRVAAVEPFADDELQDKSREQLEAKFGEYAAAADELEAAVLEANEAFTATSATYDQVFHKIELIEVLIERLEGFAIAPIPTDPRAAAGEDFTELNIALTVIEAIGAVEFIGTMGQVYKWHKAKKAANAAKAARVADNVDDAARVVSQAGRGARGAGSAAAAARIKPVKFPKGGVALGVLGLGAAAAGIYMNIKNEQQLMQFYRDNLEAYADWFDSAEEAFVLFCSGQRAMRAQIDELKSSLGLSLDDAGDQRLIGMLDDSLVGAGEVEAKLVAAERMLCSDISVADAILYSGLPSESEVQALLSARQSNLLAGGKALCKAKYPDLGLP